MKGAQSPTLDDLVNGGLICVLPDFLDFRAASVLGVFVVMGLDLRATSVFWGLFSYGHN